MAGKMYIKSVILFGVILLMSAESMAVTGNSYYSPVIGIKVEAVKNPWNSLSSDPNWMADFSNTSGNSFACMVGYAFRVSCITKDPGKPFPPGTVLKCRVDSNPVEGYYNVMYYQNINPSEPPYDRAIWGYMTSDYGNYSQVRPNPGTKDNRDDFLEIVVPAKLSGSHIVIYQGVPEVGIPELGIPAGAYPPDQSYMYNILIRYPDADIHRDRVQFQVGLAHKNSADDAYSYELAKAFYVETTYETPYVYNLLQESSSGVYTSPPPYRKPWWWDAVHPSSVNTAETIVANNLHTSLPFVINETPKKNDDGFIQRGFARLLTNDKTDTSIICAANTAADSNEYIRPPLNTDNLPDVDGDMVTVPTSSGDINIEYQYCLYYDRFSEFDPCSVPMDWIIEKVDKVVPMPHIDTSGFSWGGYYVMQWKVVVPPNCETVNSFTIWQPDNVGIFMNKYFENNGSAYYVSNPLLPTRYLEMAGTYIGEDEIYSLLPQGNDPNKILIYYDEYYHPYDITQNGIINLEEFALLADDYLSSGEHDLTGDGMVDLEDISLLLNYYLDDTRWESFLIVYPSGDFNHDNKVNMIDFARLADLWLNGSPNETNIEDLTALCENWLYGTNQ